MIKKIKKKISKKPKTKQERIMDHFKRIVRALCFEEEDPPYIMLNECEELMVYWKPTEEYIKKVMNND